jgi:hypothetical protein
MSADGSRATSTAMVPTVPCQLVRSWTMNSGTPSLVVRARPLVGSWSGSGLLTTWKAISEVSIGNRIRPSCPKIC